MKNQHNSRRRRFIQFTALGVSGLFSPSVINAAVNTPTEKFLTKVIPSSGERIPVIGLGSSRTFNVGNDPLSLDNVADVMRHFFIAGGRLIDSSPMYGSSQAAIGYGLNKLNKTNDVFSADKVWTWEGSNGPAQIEQSRQYWQVGAFDLMQVHNLVAWKEHLKTLFRMKKNGSLRYVGISTSHGRSHDALAEIMKTQPLDFVQCSYSILEREVEQNLLPLAKKRGIAIITNRPFQRGDVFDELEDKPLPAWAKNIGCDTWSQFLLKFIVSHPSVTCAIPATTNVEHVKENMHACSGPLPDMAMRKRMINYVESVL